MKPVTLIGAPIDLGCDRNGPQLAPNELRKHGLTERLRKVLPTLHDGGDLPATKRVETLKYKAHPHVKFLDGVVEFCEKLYQKVDEAHKAGTLPLVIGGDHALALGSGAATAANFDNLGIVWFDAHGDINTEASSPSGNAHGMPCAALMGFCTTQLTDIVRRTVNPHNVFWVGARDIDNGEQKLIDDHQLSVYGMDVIQSKGMPFVMDDILRKMNERGIKHIHCSIDIDGVDPTITPGTGTPVQGGVIQSDYRLFVDTLLSTGTVRAIDFVEFNPLLDQTGRTLSWCLNELEHIATLVQ